jgi:hypothetical protein
MENKTPMQELIDTIDTQQFYYTKLAKENKAMKKGVDAILTATTTLKIKAKVLLEKEKEIIEDFWKNGMKSDNGHFGTFEDYYNEKFNKNE